MAQLSIRRVVLSVGIAYVVVAVEVMLSRNNSDDIRRIEISENNDSSISKMEPWQMI
jgi:hypothetical protein